MCDSGCQDISSAQHESWIGQLHCKIFSAKDILRFLVHKLGYWNTENSLIFSISWKEAEV